MKIKGFTLIELLAVIVILAIIALIATPIILNIINDARRSTNERSIEMYASTVKNAIASYQLKEGKAPTTFEDLEEYITYEGEEVVCDEEVLNSDGSIYLASCKVGNTSVEGYTYGEKQESSLVKLCTANTVKPIALVWQSGDPNIESSYTSEEVGLLASDGDAYASGVAYTCNFIDDNESNDMTFFVLESEDEVVTFISGSILVKDETWGAGVEKLNEITSNWNKINDIEGITITIPTADQIASSVGQNFEYTEITDLPTWLYSYTTTPFAYGYWTSTAGNDETLEEWTVYLGFSNGKAGAKLAIYNLANNGGPFNVGVRPIITIPKSNIAN